MVLEGFKKMFIGDTIDNVLLLGSPRMNDIHTLNFDGMSDGLNEDGKPTVTVFGSGMKLPGIDPKKVCNEIIDLHGKRYLIVRRGFNSSIDDYINNTITIENERLTHEIEILKKQRDWFSDAAKMALSKTLTNHQFAEVARFVGVVNKQLERKGESSPKIEVIGEKTEAKRSKMR